MHEAFSEPISVAQVLTEHVTALLLNARRLYVALSNANLCIYLLSHEDDTSTATLELTVAPCKGKAIEQLGLIKEINSLVILSEGQLTLLDAHNLKVQTTLQQCKAQANIFALDTSVQSSDNPSATGVPIVVTKLIVGCKRRLVSFAWKDSQWIEPQEINLPHQIRSLAFANSSNVVLGYSDNTYGKLHVTFTKAKLTIALEEFDVAGSLAKAPNHTTSGPEKSTLGLGSLGGLAMKTGGYMGLGALGKVEKNQVVSTGKGEIIIVRDSSIVLVSSDASAEMVRSIDYGIEPADVLVCLPYIVTLLPKTSSRQHSLVVHLITSLTLVQEISLDQNLNPDSHSLLTASFGAKAPLAFITASSQTEHSIQLLRMPSWATQLDQMVQNGAYDDALPLLETVEDVLLPDKPQRRHQLLALHALSSFFRGEFDSAIDTFIELDLNPAKVICLYPEEISGKLYKDEYHREEVFGGRKANLVVHADHVSEEPSGLEGSLVPDLSSSPAPAARKWAIPPYRRSHIKEDDNASVRSGHSSHNHARQGSAREVPIKFNLSTEGKAFKRSVEVLLRYLADRRQQVNKAVAVVKPSISPANVSQSDLGSIQDLFDIPDIALSKMKSLQLQRVAQMVDTALFRCYLAVRPSLLGPLCRLDNWCIVEEVESLLKNANKFHELLDLYRGRKNHSKSLELLRTISDSESSPEDKVSSTVAYLQKLGPTHLDLIFTTADWVFTTHRTSGLQIFTADLEEVETLPRHAVSLYLAKIGSDVQESYLEHVVNMLGEDSPEFHERLIELYLERVKKSATDEEKENNYNKLLAFLQKSQQYRPDRMLARLSEGEFYEARALLLGRLGQHSGALQIYVDRLRDFATAEEYCKRVYPTLTSNPGSIFHALLKLYLRPQGDQKEPMLRPALDLLTRHGARVNAEDVLSLLPPLITAKDLNKFLSDAMIRQVTDQHNASMAREVYRSHLDHLQQAAVLLKSQYVKITDFRLCPLCHKRIGNSIIAVHLPNGMVTHYRCRTKYGD